LLRLVAYMTARRDYSAGKFVCYCYWLLYRDCGLHVCSSLRARTTLSLVALSSVLLYIDDEIFFVSAFLLCLYNEESLYENVSFSLPTIYSYGLTSIAFPKCKLLLCLFAVLFLVRPSPHMLQTHTCLGTSI